MKSRSIIVAALFSALTLPALAEDAAHAATTPAPKTGHAAGEHKKEKHASKTGHAAEHKKDKHTSKTEHAAEAPAEKPATDAMPAKAH
jgi:hypothetical protein